MAKNREIKIATITVNGKEQGMSDEFRCPHIETCPNVLQACERKVKAEGAMEVFKAKAKEYEEKRPLMNALYSAGLAMRKAQKKYFSERSKEALIASRVAEKRFDEALAACQKAK